MQAEFVFSSESVTRGHPDKLCDQISDKIAAGYSRKDPNARVVAEVAMSTGIVFTSVRFWSRFGVDASALAREAITEAGYVEGKFKARTCTILSSLIESSSPEGESEADAYGDDALANGQSTVFGYACNHTPELMPLPISLAHRLVPRLDEVREEKELPYLSPDGKTQVAVEFRRSRPYRIYGVSISAGQSKDDVPVRKQLEDDIRERVLGPAFANEPIRPDGDTRILIHPGGTGGPYRHAGLTGRKGGADTYGEFARRSDSALSGKDPTRVERIGSYAARYAAKHVVAAGLAAQCEVQLSYWLGSPGPVSLQVETFGTGKVGEDEIAQRLRRHFDFRVGALLRHFRIREMDPEKLFPHLAVYGHFGRTDLPLPWEALDSLEAIRQG
ncbi:MAG TPA: methionine adenosyltransferase [Polyangiaceae bacterium]|nr:methionine adenosyltransferase [Polyangiaceae bacterium]